MAYNLLKGKKGIIFGALDNQSIAWKVAERCHEEGAEIVLTNAPVALRFGKIKDLSEQLNCELIPADATSMDDLNELFEKSMEVLGGKIDFILHSIGMSVNVRKGNPYTDLNHDWMMKTLDVSSVSMHKMLQSAYNLDAINEGGSVVALTFIASQRTFPSYSEMAESKALLESFARSFGYHYGVKNAVRINTVSQSPTMTTAGSGVSGFDAFFKYADDMSPLGNASADDCANFCVTMFSDLTRKVTMQNIYHDGGFSSMGINPAIFDALNEGES